MSELAPDSHVFDMLKCGVDGRDAPGHDET